MSKQSGESSNELGYLLPHRHIFITYIGSNNFEHRKDCLFDLTELLWSQSSNQLGHTEKKTLHIQLQNDLHLLLALVRSLYNAHGHSQLLIQELVNLQ